MKANERLRQELIEALRDTWQAIGPDVLGDPQDNQSLHQNTVMDIVPDCLYFQEYHATEAIKLFHRMTPDEKTAVLKEAFPDEWYGW